ASGATVWRHDMAPAHELGGAVWSSITAIPAAGQVVITTSNPCATTQVRGLEDSIIAPDWNTRAPAWPSHTPPHHSCDRDLGAGGGGYARAGGGCGVAGGR